VAPKGPSTGSNAVIPATCSRPQEALDIDGVRPNLNQAARTNVVEQLQRMAGVGGVRMGFTLNSPEFALLNGDARVKALRHQVGLP